MFLVTLFFHLLHFSQPVESDSSLIVRHISIQGNQRTKAYIIQRELDFHEGDTINTRDLAKRVELNRRKVFNTSLFNFVEIKHNKDSLSIVWIF
jgi:outer membrane protein assembly factor BamA